MNKDLLLEKIRQVTEEDRETLPVFSYSKMDTFKTCPFQYNKKYNEKKYTHDTSLALELGSLCHYVLEQKGKMMLQNNGYVYWDELDRILHNGVTETDEKTQETLLGVEELKKKYFEIWYEPDNASGMSYVEKMIVFKNILDTEMVWEPSVGWRPYMFEHHFEFVWDNRAIIQGFIDRIDIKGTLDEPTAFRTVDYKTSKKVYDKSKLATSLQFGIYALAILNEFGELPEESEYRFILLDDRQYALTIGWEKRLIKAINKIFDQIDECHANGIWKPSPCPLCHWCYMCATNPNAFEYRYECPYHSLWTPTNKTFSVNKEFNPDENNIKSKDDERKLIF